MSTVLEERIGGIAVTDLVRDTEVHRSVYSDPGVFRMEMPQIIPAFGQAHGHLAYDAEHDDNGFETVFLRPVMRSASDKRLGADFVLRRA